jgi:hypothetical protein
VRKTIGLAVACVFALSGCSGDGGAGSTGASPTSEAVPAGLSLPRSSATASATGTTSPSSTASAPTSASASTSAVINDRGNVVQATGQQAGIRAPDGTQAVIFTVDAVAVDQKCSDGAPPPKNGHYLGVQVRVTTGNLDFLGGSWSMSADDFALLDPKGGMRFDLAGDSAAKCLRESQRLVPTTLRPNRQYVGTIVLDSPATTGTLVFSPPGVQGNGWEWTF